MNKINVNEIDFSKLNKLDVESSENTVYLDDKNEKIYRLKFSFISVDSPCKQAIVLHLDEFEGKIYAKGKELKKERRKFRST